jgi:hypothetical protein
MLEPIVRFVPVDRAFYGITVGGRTVIDTRMTMSVNGYVTARDVELFESLKDVRNEVAHGERATPPADAARAVERLAAKMRLGAA